MQKQILLFAFILAGALFSCKDSTINPNQSGQVFSKTSSEALLANTSWVLYSYSTSKYDGALRPEIITLHSDFKYERRWLNLPVYHTGSWSISSGGDTLIVNAIDTATKVPFEIKYKISKLNTDELNINSEDVFEYLNVPMNASYAIAGNINNSKNISLANSHIAVLWSAFNGYTNTTYIYGKGELKSDKTKFVAYLTEAPPLSALYCPKGFNYKFGLGYIVLTNIELNQNQTVGYEYDSLHQTDGYTYLFDEVVIGALENRAFLYQNMKPEQADNLPFVWLIRFPSGYSFAKGVSGQNNQKDEWSLESTYLSLYNLRTDSDPTTYVFPNWY